MDGHGFGVIVVGVDLQSVAQVESATHLCAPDIGCFSDAELRHGGASAAGKFASLAGMLAAKEALWKALPERPNCYWDDVEVDHDVRGRPHFQFRGTLGRWVNAKGVRASVSISHSAGYAMAVALVEQDQ